MDKLRILIVDEEIEVRDYTLVYETEEKLEGRTSDLHREWVPTGNCVLALNQNTEDAVFLRLRSEAIQQNNGLTVISAVEEQISEQEFETLASAWI